MEVSIVLCNFRFFCVLFQVIIEGLRESGVFSSVIASAPTTLSRDKFLASIERSNSSRAAASQSLPIRKSGRTSKSQATARKALEVTSPATSHDAAVPPLSPPGMEVDGDLIIKAL